MSDDPSQEQAPRHQPKPDLRLEGAGLSAGERWANTETTISNLQRILYHIEEGEYPHLRQCPDSDHAIQKLIRIIRPPRDSQLGSAEEYWGEILARRSRNQRVQGSGFRTLGHVHPDNSEP